MLKDCFKRLTPSCHRPPTYGLVQGFKLRFLVKLIDFIPLIAMMFLDFGRVVHLRRYSVPKIPKTTDGDMQIALFWPLVLSFELEHDLSQSVQVGDKERYQV